MVGTGDSQGAQQADLARDVRQGSPRNYSALQLFYLRRLTRLVLHRKQSHNLVDPGDWRLKLLSKAIYSTYCACVELGIAGEAKNIFLAQSPDPKGE
jgi:hypothetical protein